MKTKNQIDQLLWEEGKLNTLRQALELLFDNVSSPKTFVNADRDTIYIQIETPVLFSNCGHLVMMERDEVYENHFTFHNLSRNVSITVVCETEEEFISHGEGITEERV